MDEQTGPTRTPGHTPERSGAPHDPAGTDADRPSLIGPNGLPLAPREKVDPRSIRRQHKFKFGEDPNDDDAHPDSGWTYVKLDITETPDSPPDQKRGLGGGPESGVPCWRCRTITRIVAERTPRQMIEQSDVFVVGNRAALEKVTDSVLLLACPGCDSTMQMRRSMVERELARRRDQ